eukprot:TRINITY_DN8436_c1_g1_i2.p1 TRINITY_DN8436_c1_g1~~TRINITY_DN8436_c1_g1_i2.p1  ORF type:complete len:1269 (-),score=265.19 TRINITY_DN8436_c1_g1_i2:150-3956(-)
MVIERGEVEVLLNFGDGTELLIGRAGPGSVIGGLFALGLTSCQLMSVRKPRFLEGEEIRDEAQQLEVWYVPASELHALGVEEEFQEDLDVLRHRILRHTRTFVIPLLPRVAQFSFFRRYSAAFLRALASRIDLRICKPNELIFRERSKAESMAMLFCGTVDVKQHNQKVSSTSKPGACFGEEALLEENTRRSETVRCSPNTECLICLLRKQDFLDTIEKFPQMKLRLRDQFRTRMAKRCLSEVFSGCDKTFLRFLSTSGEAINLKWGQTACEEEADVPESLHLCCQGHALIERDHEVSESLTKGDGIGFEAALGLIPPAPAGYSLLGGSMGSLLIQITYEVVKNAVMYFPAQILPMLSVVGLESIPEDHPFFGLGNFVWERVQALLCGAFMTMSITVEMCRALEPLFKVEVYDEGVAISTEGEEAADRMPLLLYGSVRWTREGKLTTQVTAPCVLDVDVGLGLSRRHRATCIAEKTCIVWYLPSLHALRNADLVKDVPQEVLTHLISAIEEAALASANFERNIQARLRNMRTFRHFRSAILEIISHNVELQAFLPQEDVFSEGDHGECLYILLRGRVEAISNGKVATLEEGATFGEMALFGQPRRTMTVRATTLCVCYVVHREVINNAFVESPNPRENNFMFTHSGPRVKTARLRSEHDRLARHSPRTPPRSSARHPARSGRLQSRGDPSAAQKGSPDDDEHSESSENEKGGGGGGRGRGRISMRGFEENKFKVDTEDSGGNGNVSMAELSSAADDAHPMSEEVMKLLQESFSTKSLGETNLEKRFQSRSCLFQVQAPRLPSALADLYRVPRSAEVGLESAFRSVLPPAVAAAASQMHGVSTPRGLTKEHHESRDSLHWPGISSGAASASGGNRLGQSASRLSLASGKGSAACRPTYTVPLPPMAPAHAGVLSAQRSLVRPKAADCSAGVAGQLHLLASSLLRIHAKSKMGLLSSSGGELAATDLSESRTSLHTTESDSPTAGRAKRLRRIYIRPAPPAGNPPQRPRPAAAGRCGDAASGASASSGAAAAAARASTANVASVATDRGGSNSHLRASLHGSAQSTTTSEVGGIPIDVAAEKASDSEDDGLMISRTRDSEDGVSDCEDDGSPHSDDVFAGEAPKLTRSDEAAAPVGRVLLRTDVAGVWTCGRAKGMSIAAVGPRPRLISEGSSDGGRPAFDRVKSLPAQLAAEAAEATAKAAFREERKASRAAGRCARISCFEGALKRFQAMEQAQQSPAPPAPMETCTASAVAAAFVAEVFSVVQSRRC